jgi:protein-disulfide isomerase
VTVTDSGKGAPATAMDPSGLSESALREYQTVLTDEFCYCGCPHTLRACLDEHGGCRHAKRAAALAGRYAHQGYPGADIVLELSKYYQGFRDARRTFKPDPKLCKGPADAKITLVEFFDYECPHCAAAHPLLTRFVEQNASTIRFCAMLFPLTGHPNAVPAAQAALFARDHGKFWEMHDLLFEHQLSLSPGFIKGLAGQLGLSSDALGKAMTRGQHNAELDAFKEQGRAGGVQLTPSVYVNGRDLQLALTEENLLHAVDDELEWLSGGGAWMAD